MQNSRYQGHTRLVRAIYSNLSSTNSKIQSKTDRVINGINYMESTQRTYQLEFDSTYLVTCFPVSDDSINRNLSTIAIVQTGRANGKNGQIFILYQNSYVADNDDKDTRFLNLGTDGILTIGHGYRYMHYSISKL